ncbi:MAG TPA: winged helix-turn-helix domain-containing protein, partial [Candidatus Sulfopaludibacter sp.]|nr:winged helix-turn-helix domain-containing protein [Candidatus Sulfopaludibacter sp.]
MQRRLLSAGRLRVADCVVDLDQRTVLTQAGPIRPRPKVFDVLLYLVENRGRLVTKAELLDTLWRDVSVTDDAVMACISEIRRLLGDDARHPRLVLTAPRKGYIFAAPVREDGESGAHKAEGEVPPQTAPRGGPRLRWIALAAGGMAVCAFLAWSLWLTDRSRPALAGWWRLEETGGNVI